MEWVHIDQPLFGSVVYRGGRGNSWLIQSMTWEPLQGGFEIGAAVHRLGVGDDHRFDGQLEQSAQLGGRERSSSRDSQLLIDDSQRSFQYSS